MVLGLLELLELLLFAEFVELTQTIRRGLWFFLLYYQLQAISLVVRPYDCQLVMC
jgi:hypothetical protein